MCTKTGLLQPSVIMTCGCGSSIKYACFENHGKWHFAADGFLGRNRNKSAVITSCFIFTKYREQ